MKFKIIFAVSKEDDDEKLIVSSLRLFIVSVGHTWCAQILKVYNVIQGVSEKKRNPTIIQNLKMLTKFE